MKDYPASTYRQISAHGASPVQLVVMLYDAALQSSHRAVRALEIGDLEQQTQALNHVLEVIGELDATLDFARGGEVAHNLSRFYALARQQILEASARRTKAPLQKLLGQLSALREAWEQVERATAAAFPGPAPSQPAVRSDWRT